MPTPARSRPPAAKPSRPAAASARISPPRTPRHRGPTTPLAANDALPTAAVPMVSTAAASPRDRLIQAARQRFFAHGFRRVTMDQLAVQLGMSKKTLYALFPSKHALIEALLRDKLADLQQHLHDATAQPHDDFPTRLQRVLAVVQRESSEIQPPFLEDLQRETPQLFAIVKTGRQQLIQHHFDRLLQQGRRAGWVRRDIPGPLLIATLLAAINAIVNPPTLLQLGLTPRAAFEAVLAIVLRGALTDQARSRL